MEEGLGLSQENYLRLALRLRCGFCQITLTSCFLVDSVARLCGVVCAAVRIERCRRELRLCDHRSEHKRLSAATKSSLDSLQQQLAALLSDVDKLPTDVRNNLVSTV